MLKLPISVSKDHDSRGAAARPARRQNRRPRNPRHRPRILGWHCVHIVATSLVPSSEPVAASCPESEIRLLCGDYRSELRITKGHLENHHSSVDLVQKFS